MSSSNFISGINIVFLVILYVVIVLFVFFVFLPVFRTRNFLKQEDEYPIPDDVVAKGKKHFKESKVLICGLAKNVSKRIGIIKYNLEKIVSFFDTNNFAILIVENDSDDQSRKLLFDLKPFFYDPVNSKDRLILLCPGWGLASDAEDESVSCKFTPTQTCGKNRIFKMVQIRNTYMKYIKQKFTRDQFDYCVMLDLDLDGEFCDRGFLSCGYYFSSCATTHGIGANSIIKNLSYYDSYSLSLKDYCFSILHGFFKTTSSSFESDLFEVESCFGGLIIYKYNSIYGRRYFFQPDFLSMHFALCEHKSLNKNLTCDGGKLFINPRFIYKISHNDQN